MPILSLVLSTFLSLPSQAHPALDRALGFRDLARSCEGRISENFPRSPKIGKIEDVETLSTVYAPVYLLKEGEEGTAILMYPQYRVSHGVQVELINVTKVYGDWRTISTFSRLYRSLGRIPRVLRENGRQMEETTTVVKSGDVWISTVKVWINAELMDAVTYEQFVRKVAAFEKEVLP